jgi:hypothetical protein
LPGQTLKKLSCSAGPDSTYIVFFLGSRHVHFSSPPIPKLSTGTKTNVLANSSVCCGPRQVCRYVASALEIHWGCTCRPMYVEPNFAPSRQPACLSHTSVHQEERKRECSQQGAEGAFNNFVINYISFIIIITSD